MVIPKLLLFTKRDDRHEDGPTLIELDRPAIARGDEREISFRLAGGAHRLLAFWRDDAGGATERTIELPIVVANPELDREIAACARCRGDFAPTGLSGAYACNCRTNDAGKECRDRDDCEGQCEFERMEIVSPEGPLRCGPNGCTREPALGRAVGRCTERTIVLGCHSLIHRGARDAPPFTLPRRVARICAD